MVCRRQAFRAQGALLQTTASPLVDSRRPSPQNDESRALPSWGKPMPDFDVLMLLGFLLPGAVICAIHRHLTRGPR
jgi:hypothetical protein